MKGLLIFAAGAIALAAVWSHGHGVGVSATENDYRGRLLAVEDSRRAVRAMLVQTEADRLSAMSELLEARRMLDEQSSQDPDAGSRAFSADSMRRLNAAVRGE